MNLVALLSRARSLGLEFAPDLKPKEVARAVVKALQATPAEERDEWYLPTLPEANLGLGDYDEVERTIHQYAAADDERPSTNPEDGQLIQAATGTRYAALLPRSPVTFSVAAPAPSTMPWCQTTARGGIPS